jgi:hypothetical protein
MQAAARAARGAEHASNNGPENSFASTVLTAGNELCERLAYYGLATNLVTYITQVLGGDPAFAAILVRRGGESKHSLNSSARLAHCLSSHQRKITHPSPHHLTAHLITLLR